MKMAKLYSKGDKKILRTSQGHWIRHYFIQKHLQHRQPVFLSGLLNTNKQGNLNTIRAVVGLLYSSHMSKKLSRTHRRAIWHTSSLYVLLHVRCI